MKEAPSPKKTSTPSSSLSSIHHSRSRNEAKPSEGKRKQAGPGRKTSERRGAESAKEPNQYIPYAVRGEGNGSWKGGPLDLKSKRGGCGKGEEREEGREEAGGKRVGVGGAGVEEVGKGSCGVSMQRKGKWEEE